MNYLDISIIVLSAYGLLKGFSNGIIKEISGLVGLFIGVYVAITFSSYLYPQVTPMVKNNSELVPIISFATLFFVSVLAIRTLGYILDKITRALALGLVSKILGAFFGVLKVLVLFMFLIVLNKEYKLVKKQTKNKSILLEPLEKTTEYLLPEINKHKKNILEKIEQEKEG